MKVNLRCAACAILGYCVLGAHGSRVLAQSVAQPNSTISLPPKSVSAPEASLTVEIIDYARIAPRTLRQAEQVASGIFARAGVTLSWVDCAEGREPQLDPDCRSPIGLDRLGVRIVPRIPVVEGLTEDATLGYTIGDWTAISLEWAETASANGLGAVSDLLGSAIAHEIGHVLLGPNSHSVSGLMRPRWDTKQLQSAAQHALLFVPERAATIRAEVMARTRPPATLAMAQPTPSK